MPLGFRGQEYRSVQAPVPVARSPDLRSVCLTFPQRVAAWVRPARLCVAL
jgi:hypothetical protein